MNKLNCDIIKDLIPSYVEGLCSDATTECMEEHVRDCNQCRNLVEIYRDAEISDCNMEMKQIDGFKKFHSQMKLMNLFSIVLVLLLIGLGTYSFCTNYITMSTLIYYVLFPICIIGLYIISGNKGNLKHAEKEDYIVAALSIIDTVCAIGFMFYATNCVISGKSIFYVKDSQLGPIIHKVWGVMFLLLLIGFVYLLRRMLRSNIGNQWIMCIQMVGMFLLLAYVTLLRNLTSIEFYYKIFIQISIIIGSMGIAGIIMFTVIGHKGKKGKKAI